MPRIIKIIAIILIAASFTSCINKVKKPEAISPPGSYHPLTKLHLTGDFNGDGKKDTLYQHCINSETGREIDSMPECDWDSLGRFFQNQACKVYLSSTISNVKPLYPHPADGFSSGLYCLINVGNLDKKAGEEIALVMVYSDYSGLNSCRIFSLSTGQWQSVGQFEVFEGAFQYTGDKPRFDSIPGFLQKKNGIWYYSDYLKEDGGMQLTMLLLDSIQPASTQ